MTDRLVSADAHAYVDNSLDSTRRRAFEATLREDADLRRRVDMWAAQNEAIRLAFGARANSRGPLSLGRPANESGAPRGVSESALRRVVGGDRVGAAAATPRRVGLVDARKLARPAPARRMAAWPKRIAAALCLSVAMLCLSAFGGPADPRDPLMDAAVSAYRAFGEAASAPMDYATQDSQALGRWLTPKFLPAPLSADLRIPGWRLIGARVVSGTTSAAAFILFENSAGDRAGLLVEPLDAPPDWAPASRNVGPIVLASRTEDSEGVAAVGRSVGIVAALMRVWSQATAGGT